MERLQFVERLAPLHLRGCNSLSYQDPDEISDGFARRLSAASAKPGNVVAIGLERGPGFLVSMISLLVEHQA